MWKRQTGIAHPPTLLPDDCHLFEKVVMQGMTCVCEELNDDDDDDDDDMY